MSLSLKSSPFSVRHHRSMSVQHLRRPCRPAASGRLMCICSQPPVRPSPCIAFNELHVFCSMSGPLPLPTVQSHARQSKPTKSGPHRSSESPASRWLDSSQVAWLCRCLVFCEVAEQGIREVESAMAALWSVSSGRGLRGRQYMLSAKARAKDPAGRQIELNGGPTPPRALV